MMAANCGENQPLRLLISSILIYKKDDASMVLPEKKGDKLLLLTQVFIK